MTCGGGDGDKECWKCGQGSKCRGPVLSAKNVDLIPWAIGTHSKF